MTVEEDGSLDGMPTSNDQGINSFTVTVTDSDNNVAQTQLIINVDNIQTSTVYEAETATIEGVVNISGPNGSSEGRIADFTGKGPSAYIEFSVSNLEDITRQANISFNYYHGATADRPLTLSVNDVVIDPALSFPSTGSWSVSASTSTTRINLEPGDNKIKISALTESSGANIDYMLVNIMDLATQDDDMDGVNNDSDTCPDSDKGIRVDSSGCEIVNVAPVADRLFVDLNEGETVNIQLAGSDGNGDELTYQITEQPKNGIVSINGNIATYTHTVVIESVDSFSYVVSDGITQSDIALASLTIKLTDDTPIAVPLSFKILPGEQLNISLVGRDSDSASLTYTINDRPSKGVLSELSGNEISYTPNVNANGTDTFTYTVSDGNTLSESAEVQISIENNIAALYGVASQGSQYASFTADLALDGDITTYQHTQCNATDNWWQVSLPNGSAVGTVKVTIRNSNLARSKGAKVYIDNSSYSGNLDNATLIGELSKSTEAQVFNIPEGPVEANFVIVKGTDDCLHLAEVEVLGSLASEPYFESHVSELLVAFDTPKDAPITQIKGSDYQGDTITYTLDEGSPFSIDQLGNITLTGNLPETGSEYTVNVILSDGENSTSTAITIKTTAANAVEKAVATGNSDLVTKSELYEAVLNEIEKNRTQDNALIAQLFNLNSDGTAKSDGTSLTSVSWDPSRDSALMKNTFGINR